MYLFLLVIFRINGKRSLAQITTFDAVLLLIISEAIQQAMIDGDNSLTNAFLIVLTLVGTDLVLSFLTLRFRALDKLVNDVPLVLVENGVVHHDRLRRARVSLDDVLENARTIHGLERMEQIKYAVLERDGHISIIPSWVPWVTARATTEGSR